MAKHVIPNRREALEIDRRQVLLASAVALTAAGMASVTENAEATEPAQELDLAKALPVSSEAWASVISDTTAFRIQEIEARNRLREESGLPVLSIPKELRRMKMAADQEVFQRFEAIHAKAVWDEVLKPIRDEKGDPNWRPGWMGGMALQNDFYRILRQRFRAESITQNC
jgi:hypothetical protein